MLKPDAQPWTVQEQIVQDPVSGLTLQFEVAPDGWRRLTLFGAALPFGNRTLVFGPTGAFDGGGVATQGLCKPAWLVRPEELS